MTSRAVTETWTTGAGTADWATASNWLGTNTPPASGDTLDFGTTTGTTVLNNNYTTSAFNVGNIVFLSGGASYTINGNDFLLGGNINNNSGVLQTVSDNFVLSSGPHTFQLGPIALSGVISGSGPITVTSSGTVTLSGSNTYSGGTTIGSSAVIKLGNAAAVGTGTLTIAGSAGMLDNVSGADITLGNAVALGSGALTYLGSANNLTLSTGTIALTGNATINVNANSLVVNSVLSETGGSRSFTKGGAGGTLVLNGLNTYTGSTTVLAGVLSVNNLSNIGLASSIGTGNATSTATNQASLVIGAGLTTTGTLQYTGTTASTDRLFTIALQGGALDASGSGAITFSNTNSILSTTTTLRNFILTGTNEGDNTLASAWVNALGVGANTLTKNGTGKWVLSGSNSYTGATTINAGTLQFAKEVSLYSNTGTSWTAAKITVASGATLALNVGGAGEFTSADVATISSIGTTSNGLKSGAILGLDTTNAASGTFTYATAIANTNGGTNVIGVTKLGSNTLNLTGTNTYTGVTTVSAGTLLINGANSGAGATNVNAGTLGGAGTIAGAVTVGDGAGGHDSVITAGVTPSTTIGTLATGALTLNSDATFAFVLNSSTALADQLNVTGAVNLVSGAAFSFSDLGVGTVTLGTVFTLINNDGSDAITGVFANLANGSTFTSGANTYLANYAGGTGNDLTLTTVVPEPSTALLMGVGLVAVISMIRRRPAR